MEKQERYMTKGVIIVTGSSRGIGAATARLAAAEGYDVLINYSKNHAAAEQLVEELEQQGVVAQCVAADVSDEAGVAALFDRAEAIGSVTAVVNNAGVLEQQMPLHEMSVERWRRVFDTNVFGTMLCCREAIRRWSQSHEVGSNRAIVNVSSIAASLGAPGEYVDYAASKGAVDSLTKGLAAEVAWLGVRVNAVRPGVIHTDIHASGGEPDRVTRVSRSVPMGRGGQTDEVAHTILWLLSEKASYVTGTLLDVSGGR